MKLRSLLWLVWSLGALAGCAEPAQLGGLGVFNPSGFAGRMALASRVKATPSGETEALPSAAPSAAPTASPRAGSSTVERR